MLTFKSFVIEAFIYDDNSGPNTFRNNPNNPISNWDPHPHYEKHLDNQAYLNFIYKHPNTTPQEKMQAVKELRIADRKLDFWRRHPKFDHDIAAQITSRVANKWNSNNSTRSEPVAPVPTKSLARRTSDDITAGKGSSEQRWGLIKNPKK
jgi:hypothetical protein